MVDVAMGGRASEELFLGHDNVTTGCSSDLNRATSIGYSYVRELGMLDGVNLINSNKRDLSDDYNYKIDMEVQRILRKSLSDCKKVLWENKELVKKLTDELVERETISNEEFVEIYNNFYPKKLDLSQNDAQKL